MRSGFENRSREFMFHFAARGNQDITPPSSPIIVQHENDELGKNQSKLMISAETRFSRILSVLIAFMAVFQFRHLPSVPCSSNVSRIHVFPPFAWDCPLDDCGRGQLGHDASGVLHDASGVLHQESCMTDFGARHSTIRLHFAPGGHQ